MTLVVIFLPVRGGAHTPSETYFALSVAGTNLTGRWDVALRDLHQGMGLGLEDVKRVAPAELQEREEALALDVIAGVGLRADGTPVKLIITDYTTLPLNGLDYARLLFNASGILTPPDVIEIDAAVDARLHVGLGDDQRPGLVEECVKLRRDRHHLAAARQHRHIAAA